MAITIISWIMLAIAIAIAVKSGQPFLMLAALTGSLGALIIDGSPAGRRGRP